MNITQTVNGVTQVQTLSLGTTATRILTTRKASCVLHVKNNHASQDIYVQWRQAGLQGEMAITSATAYETVPAGKSMQFSMTEQLEFWGAGSGASTTAMAVEMRSPV